MPYFLLTKHIFCPRLRVYFADNGVDKPLPVLHPQGEWILSMPNLLTTLFVSAYILLTLLCYNDYFIELIGNDCVLYKS